MDFWICLLLGVASAAWVVFCLFYAVHVSDPCTFSEMTDTLSEPTRETAAMPRVSDPVSLALSSPETALPGQWEGQ